MMTKVCPKCKEEKSVDSYHRDRSKSSGISSYCKVCSNSRKRDSSSAKRWRERNPEKARESIRRWRERNHEIAKYRQREYYKNNSEKERKRVSEWIKNNRDKVNYRERRSKSKQRWKKNNPDKVRESRRRRSLNRKLYSIEYKGGKCEDCGIIATMENRSIFDFHHLEPSTKKNEVTELQTKSIEKLKEELDKCVLLCANCHRLRHQNYQDGLRPTL